MIVLRDLEEKYGNCRGLPSKFVTEYGAIDNHGQTRTFPYFGNEKIAWNLASF
jgi:hypothetical protein